jgi:hypothetical protein
MRQRKGCIADIRFYTKKPVSADDRSVSLNERCGSRRKE